MWLLLNVNDFKLIGMVIKIFIGFIELCNIVKNLSKMN